MQTTWFLSILTWVVLTACVLALAIYRHVVARGECDVIHLRESELPLVPAQEEFAHRLDTVDYWGKALTVASVAYGLVLVAVFLYEAWNQGLSS
jgi:hypothetical protein